jgi:hypothetical protein
MEFESWMERGRKGCVGGESKSLSVRVILRKRGREGGREGGREREAGKERASDRQ